jgi:hypothetical protein
MSSSHLGKDIYDWDIKDVSAWLYNRNLRNYIPHFEKNNISGYDLCFITNEDLKNELNITNLHERLYLLKEIRKMLIESCMFILFIINILLIHSKINN